ncbi:protein tyrosine phosphatase [Labrys sp. WJW]|uniref:tyrosine phosphatase family protein n=1 Tax=Labrys sp. WJW TaxID=1737983 RepID=UPI00082992F3|nr:protein-tyrosine phosphatase family protein [Labrys sp. WJW]OCC05722.1 protein tyrosine phosphatase [Labrys sp. WJW]
MQINVCSLSRLDATVAATGARQILTLINAGTKVIRPDAVEEDRHLFLSMNDIVELAEEGQILPGEDHLSQLLAFVRAWDQATPLVVHCYAGVSRSTAAAFTAACALNPTLDEHELAQTIRRLSPTATPNRRIVALADVRLGRNGRMLAAIDAIGRGEDCFEGVPFALQL